MIEKSAFEKFSVGIEYRVLPETGSHDWSEKCLRNGGYRCR